MAEREIYVYAKLCYRKKLLLGKVGNIACFKDFNVGTNVKVPIFCAIKRRKIRLLWSHKLSELDGV